MIVGYPLIKHIVELRRLMENSQFNCLFQPVVSLSSGGVTGWEALLRGPENYEFQRPDRIFEIAEATGHLVELEIISHQTAIAQVEELSTDQKLFLNVHPQVILDERHDLASSSRIRGCNFGIKNVFHRQQLKRNGWL